jgi:hypothetical protein
LSHFNQNPFSSKSSPLFKHFPISFLAFARDETTLVNHCITDSLANEEEEKLTKKTTFIGNNEGIKKY